MIIDIPDNIEKMINEQAKAEQITASELIIKLISRHCSKNNPKILVKCSKISGLEVLQSDIIIDGLCFKQTCFACPEQYDVYQDDKQVGYVRLRHGYLSLSNTDISEDWFELGTGDKNFPKPYRLIGDDRFDDDNERLFYLTLFAKIIHKKSKEPTWQANDDTQFLADFIKNWQS